MLGLTLSTRGIMPIYPCKDGTKNFMIMLPCTKLQFTGNQDHMFWQRFSLTLRYIDETRWKNDKKLGAQEENRNLKNRFLQYSYAKHKSFLSGKAKALAIIYPKKNLRSTKKKIQQLNSSSILMSNIQGQFFAKKTSLA